MSGARYVREWNSTTGNTRGWMETLDHAGNIRRIRPDINLTGGEKFRYFFDQLGNYTGKW